MAYGLSVAEELATLSWVDISTPTLEAGEEVVVLSHVGCIQSIWIQNQSFRLGRRAAGDDECWLVRRIECTAEVGSPFSALLEEVRYRARVVEAKSDNYEARFASTIWSVEDGQT